MSKGWIVALVLGPILVIGIAVVVILRMTRESAAENLPTAPLAPITLVATTAPSEISVLIAENQRLKRQLVESHAATTQAVSLFANKSAQIAQLTAKAEQLVTDNQRLKTSLANAMMQVQKASREADANKVPDPEHFKQFAKHLAEIMTSEMKQNPPNDSPGQKTKNTISFSVSGVDIKKTDSVITPIVGVIELSEIEINMTTNADDGSLIFSCEYTRHHTITMTYVDGKWKPIKDYSKIESESQFPDGLPDVVKMGQESTNDGQWLANVAETAQSQ